MGKRTLKYENSLRDLWDNIKYNNIRFIGVPEEEREDKKLKTYFKK